MYGVDALWVGNLTLKKVKSPTVPGRGRVEIHIDRCIKSSQCRLCSLGHRPLFLYISLYSLSLPTYDYDYGDLRE